MELHHRTERREYLIKLFLRSSLEVIYTAPPPANGKELEPRVPYTSERQWGV